MPPCLACRLYGRSLAVQPDCLKGWVVCGTVYEDMHSKDLQGSIPRVGYRIPLVPDFYLVGPTTFPSMLNNHSYGIINQSPYAGFYSASPGCAGWSHGRGQSAPQ